MTNQLERFEELMERVVEGSFARLFSGQLQPQQIVARMARVMEDNARDNIAPDRYTVYLNPKDLEAIRQEANLESILSEQILCHAAQSGFEIANHPEVTLLPNRELPPKTLSVVADFTTVNESTQIFNKAEMREKANMLPDGNTYLIVDGKRFVQLTNPVYTIGRRLDCDVVLTDARVSRRHAQLRWRFGRYMLFDLGSTGGTSVNGKPISEAVLEPGDVFSLGGVDIIYGRDAPDGKVLSEGDTTNSWRKHKKTSDHVA